MTALYNIGIQLYFLTIRIASFFSKKARLWVNGRKNQSLIRFDSSIWFHFASLGEFEQGRPVLEEMKRVYPGDKIVVTFFSPSGYEVRKNTPLADAVYYLPLDTPANARKFIDTVQPRMAVFTKYEYWYHYFNEMHKRELPLYVISAIFRPQQVFFKWYGGLQIKILRMATHFFVQDEQSKDLLQSLGLQNVTISGDTRFDRVWVNARQRKILPVINEFKNGHKVFIVGSTWPQDDKLIAGLITQYPAWKFIIAPHETSNENINKLIDMLPANTAIRYSELATHHPPVTARPILIIDNIGMLSSLYYYGDIAYIGGGFGAGIHNTLEAAAFGLPVIFGPNYSRFKEARDLISLKAGFSIADETQLKNIANTLITDELFYKNASEKIKAYVFEQKGATKVILDYLSAGKI